MNRAGNGDETTDFSTSLSSRVKNPILQTDFIPNSIREISQYTGKGQTPDVYPVNIERRIITYGYEYVKHLAFGILLVSRMQAFEQLILHLGRDVSVRVIEIMEFLEVIRMIV